MRCGAGILSMENTGLTLLSFFFLCGGRCRNPPMPPKISPRFTKLIDGPFPFFPSFLSPSSRFSPSSSEMTPGVTTCPSALRALPDWSLLPVPPVWSSEVPCGFMRCSTISIPSFRAEGSGGFPSRVPKSRRLAASIIFCMHEEQTGNPFGRWTIFPVSDSGLLHTKQYSLLLRSLFSAIYLFLQIG